jgi:hypothetical protein
LIALPDILAFSGSRERSELSEIDTAILTETEDKFMPTPADEIDGILVDCYDEYEQMAAWEVAFSDGVEVPFRATLLGIPVEVVGFRVNGSNTVQCQVIREDKQRWVSVEDLDEEGLPADIRHLLSLYHTWLEGDY